MINFHEIKLGPVYWVKRGPVNKRLRIKTRGVAHNLVRTAWCGKTIDATYYWISYIDAQGNIELTCEVTNEKFKFNVGVKNDNN